MRPSVTPLNIDSSAEADCLNEDHMFAVSDVEGALECPEGKEVIISVSGRGKMELSELQCMCKLTHWYSLFPIDLNTVLHALRNIVKELATWTSTVEPNPFGLVKSSGHLMWEHSLVFHYFC